MGGFLSRQFSRQRQENDHKEQHGDVGSNLLRINPQRGRGRNEDRGQDRSARPEPTARDERDGGHSNYTPQQRKIAHGPYAIACQTYPDTQEQRKQWRIIRINRCERLVAAHH